MVKKQNKKPMSTLDKMDKNRNQLVENNKSLEQCNICNLVRSKYIQDLLIEIHKLEERDSIEKSIRDKILSLESDILQTRNGIFKTSCKQHLSLIRKNKKLYEELHGIDSTKSLNYKEK